jgi:hypothetical protein
MSFIVDDSRRLEMLPVPETALPGTLGSSLQALCRAGAATLSRPA